MDSPPSDEPSAGRPGSFQEVRWRLSDALVALAPVLAIRVLTEFDLPKDWAPVPRWVGPVVLIGQLAWFLGVPVWLARRRGTATPRLPRIRSVLIEAALAVPLLILTWFALGAVLLAWDALAGERVHPQNPFAGGSWSRPEFLLILVLAATAAPVAEEVLFRGLVFNALQRRMPVVVALVLQALVFGFLHTYGMVHGTL